MSIVPPGQTIAAEDHPPQVIRLAGPSETPRESHYEEPHLPSHIAPSHREPEEERDFDRPPRSFREDYGSDRDDRLSSRARTRDEDRRPRQLPREEEEDPRRTKYHPLRPDEEGDPPYPPDPEAYQRSRAPTSQRTARTVPSLPVEEGVPTYSQEPEEYQYSRAPTTPRTVRTRPSPPLEEDDPADRPEPEEYQRSRPPTTPRTARTVSPPPVEEGDGPHQPKPDPYEEYQRSRAPTTPRTARTVPSDAQISPPRSYAPVSEGVPSDEAGRPLTRLTAEPVAPEAAPSFVRPATGEY